MKKDLHKIRPYGDHLDDGRVQLSFTLPVPAGVEAREAARQYGEKLGLARVQVVWMEAIGEESSFFVLYGEARPQIDFTRIRLPRLDFPILPPEELVRQCHQRIRRKIVVVGGTTGTDAHTVGIDAILSLKGIGGDHGLESYPIFKVVNLRAQVDNRHLVDRAVEVGADAILVSKIVTQHDQHLKDLQDLAKLMKQERRLPGRLIKIIGGPRIDHPTARRLGFDAGFGPGTRPSEVANYIVHELTRRLSHETPHRLEGEGAREAPPKRRSLFGWLSGGGKDS